ncbi:MAG: hypothetical protein HY057_11010 [Rhodospirillales bacterium]|nr:hypothetical protein [Rhodospirillales bacterium]
MDKIPFDPYDFFAYLSAGLVILAGIYLTFGFPPVFGPDMPAIKGLLVIGVVYVLGQMNAWPAGALFEDWLVFRILGRPEEVLLGQHKTSPWAALFPYYYQPLNEAAIKRLDARIAGEMAAGKPLRGPALFVHVRFHPDTLGNEKLMARLSVFLNKYGFCRNVSFAALSVGVLMLAVVWLVGPTRPNLVWYGLASFAAGVGLFYRYLFFFRQYSFEMFNVYAGGTAKQKAAKRKPSKGKASAAAG